jgi:hypothetical protein
MDARRNRSTSRTSPMKITEARVIEASRTHLVLLQLVAV